MNKCCFLFAHFFADWNLSIVVTLTIAVFLNCFASMPLKQKKTSASHSRRDVAMCGHPNCKDEVSDDQDAINCQLCLLWFHLSCTKLDGKTYEVLKNCSSSGLYWFCTVCQLKVDQNLKISNTINSKSAEIKSEIENLKVSIESDLKNIEKKLLNSANTQKETLTQKFKSYAETVASKIDKTVETNNTITTTLNKDLKSLRTNIETKIVSEKEQIVKESKMLNLCIFNIPESSGDDSEAYKLDINKLKSILSERINLKKEDVKAAFRVGKIADKSKARPFIIKFTSAEKRKEVLKLKNVYYLNEETREKTRVYISPDRTIKEQIEHKKLVNELKLRRSNGESNIGIRNAKIVQILSFRQNPQLFWG